MIFKGYRREDGKVGIRNKILVIAVDECCEGIVRAIAKENKDAVVLTNWYTCMLGGNEETFNQMIAVAQNPNVAGVIVVAMGCGSIQPEQIGNEISGKPVKLMTCEKVGGTRKSIAAGIEMLKEIETHISSLKREDCYISELVIGIKCGGSDTSSGIASNPSVGKAADKLVDLGSTCIGGELFELIGCEDILKSRAVSERVAEKIVTLINNEKTRWGVPGADVETMSVGNCVGGLTTIEEKSLGALHKMGTKPIQDVLQINKYGVERPGKHGFYLSEATMLCGGAGVNYSSYGAHIILWTTGAAGFNNSIVPVIRVSGNQSIINEDIDIDATGIMNGSEGIDEVSDRIVEKVVSVAGGALTQVEGVGDATMTLYQKDQRVESMLNLNCIK